MIHHPLKINRELQSKNLKSSPITDPKRKTFNEEEERRFMGIIWERKNELMRIVFGRINHEGEKEKYQFGFVMCIENGETLVEKVAY